jgi:BirA family biotin operon repressor/biotin-[acetyl-CoA-carboxylase] ligase
VITRKLSRITREFDEIGSTNAEMALCLSHTEMEEGIVFFADFQSDGRGYQGNRWLSQRGKNLLFSILLRPDLLPPEHAFYISRIVSLSLIEMLDKQGIKAMIKWPNDILAGSGKICGILIENSIRGRSITHSIIGIGLNVNQYSFSPEIPSPTSMILEKGCHYDRKLLLSEFRTSLESWYGYLLSGETGKILDFYQEHLYLLRVPARFSDGQSEFTAAIQSVLPSGELELLTDNGETRRFSFKEIEYLDERKI